MVCRSHIRLVVLILVFGLLDLRHRRFSSFHWFIHVNGLVHAMLFALNLSFHHVGLATVLNGLRIAHLVNHIVPCILSLLQSLVVFHNDTGTN